MNKRKILKMIIGFLVLGVLLSTYLNSSGVDDTKSTQHNVSVEFKFKPAKFRLDTPFMCGANISRKTAKLYFDSNTLKVEFDNRQYISNRNGGIQAELTYYVTSDHYTNPNQLYMEVEKDGSSIRISGDSIDPKGIVYSCFEIDEN